MFGLVLVEIVGEIEYGVLEGVWHITDRLRSKWQKFTI